MKISMLKWVLEKFPNHTLGIIIGVSSVIVLMAIGQGAVKGVIDELSALGTNLIFIEPGSSEEDGQKGAAGSALTLTREDGEAIIDSKILGVERLTSMIDFTAQAITPSNNIGTQGSLTFAGESVVVDPRGKTIAEIPSFEEGVLVCEIPLEQLTNFRKARPVLRDSKKKQ